MIIRIHETVYERLTIEDAEQFVQENIGRINPYLGIIYLHLGELYELDGQLRDAEDIYESIPNLFPNEKHCRPKPPMIWQNIGVISLRTKLL